MGPILTVPTLMTLARLVLLVPICLLMTGGWVAQSVAFVLYVAAAVTDYLDGWWARKFNAGSDFGKMLDPVVDKIFVAALCVMMAANGTIAGLWLACPIIILGREFLIAGLREFMGARGQGVPVTQLAKWKTTVQMIALGVLLFPGLHALGLFLLLVATGLTVVTGAGYLRGVIPKAPIH